MACEHRRQLGTMSDRMTIRMTIKVLVIEDEQALRENLISLLNHAGFRAVAAVDGADGVIQAKRVQPQLILCDVLMPGLDGYGVLTQLRQDPLTATIPFIFLSGQADYAQVRKGMNLGADDYLTKPLSKATLVDAINSRLKKQQMREVASPDISQSDISQPVEDNDLVDANLPIDRLTQLPNRQTLLQALQLMLDRSRQYDQMVVLLSLNIARFGSINSAYGYSVGDSLLQQLADRLQTQVGRNGLVGRTNGDEFVIGFDQLAWEEDAQRWAEIVAQICAEAFLIDGQEIMIHVNIGGACSPQGVATIEQLLLQAEMARRACAEMAQFPYVFHDASTTEKALESRLLETELNRAILQQEFQVYYQPQMSLPTGQIIGAEALLRWRHPYRGMVAPDQFITIAEDLGLIVTIGEWVLRTACLQASLWQSQAAMPLNTPLKMSVNLSMRQLQQENLAEQVMRILQVTEWNPRQLTLELTETNLMADMDMTIHTLRSLREIGVQIAIDDFGKGYSSLHYLNRLPVDVLKIDQSFVQQVTTDTHAAAIVNAIITMARDLNLVTVAEGVETLEQVTFLQEHGCHIMQGHLYSPALPQVEFERLWQRQYLMPVA
jgi:diguanylate cyclase